MQKLNFSSYQIKKPEKKVVSERAEVVGMFLEKLNADRGKYPPLTAARVGMMLAPIKSAKDLRAFYGECNDHQNFSSYFWWCYSQVKKQV